MESRIQVVPEVLIIVLCLIAGSGCGSLNTVAPRSPETRAIGTWPGRIFIIRGSIDDIYLGFSERVVRERLGEPFEITEGTIEQRFGGEIHSVLWNKLSPQTEVKQLTYELFGLRCAIWFAKDSRAEWVVVGDVTYSKDVRF